MRRAAILGLVLFASYAYFYEAGGWNQNTRVDLVRAIVEQGTIRIDDYQNNTGDRSTFDGHYYADKAPGASFVAVPAVAAARAVLGWTGHQTDTRAAVESLAYVATVAASGLPAAIACVCLFFLARRLGASESAATLAAVALGLATPFWAYATLLYGHALAAACLMAALLAADRLRDPGGSAARETGLGLAVGLAAGWAVVTEFPAAIAAVILAVLALANAATARSRVVRVGAGIVVGAGVCAAVLLAYQHAAFGSAFHLSYASEENPDLLRRGFFGITAPKPSIMFELLFGAYRGLLPLAPVLVVAPIGLWLLMRSPSMRRTGVAAAILFVAAFLLNAAYEHWEGGWSYGPRQIGTALGFLAMGLAPLWTVARARARAMLMTLVLVGIASSLVAVSTTAQPPADYARPMRELLWPAFRAGNLSLNTQSIDVRDVPGGWAAIGHDDREHVAWNLGEKMGLRGLPSLLPLLGIWILGAVFWLRTAPRTEVRSALRQG
jgi:hypothetical protein